MEQYIFPVIITLAGGFFLVRNIIHLRNEEKLREYVENSPKAKLWLKKFGIEKTVSLSKKYFLPLGILISFCLLGFGILSLSNLIRFA